MAEFVYEMVWKLTGNNCKRTTCRKNIIITVYLFGESFNYKKLFSKAPSQILDTMLMGIDGSFPGKRLIDEQLKSRDTVICPILSHLVIQ